MTFHRVKGTELLIANVDRYRCQLWQEFWWRRLTPDHSFGSQEEAETWVSARPASNNAQITPDKKPVIERNASTGAP
jgi:hypothetical protein